MARRPPLQNPTLFDFGRDAGGEPGGKEAAPAEVPGSGPGARPGPRVFTVGELTDYLSGVIEGDSVLQDVWVKGEVSNFHHHSSGHMYFDLKDSRSVLRCVMFREANRNLRFRMDHGLKLLVRGSLMVYAARGEYELRVLEARPEGLGALYLAFEQLKKKLEAEGLFDPSLKRPLPVLPKVVGVVTSPTGAVLQDIRNILFDRFPNAHLLLAPSRVQGEGAAREVAEAIGLLNSLREDAPEVIIVARGGGSLEDLWAFNEEAVARAIRASRIPVVSAVGHETDFTIADFAADARAPTPSKAAEMVMPRRADVEERIRMLAGNLRRELAGRFDQSRLRTDELSRALGTAIGSLLTRRRERLQRLTAVLDVMSPLQVLGRGYSITIRQATGRAVRDPADLAPGEDIRTLLSRGDLISTVVAVNRMKEGRPWPRKETRKRAPRKG